MLLYINNNKVLQVQEDNCDYDDETWRRWGFRVWYGSWIRSIPDIGGGRLIIVTPIKIYYYYF